MKTMTAVEAKTKFGTVLDAVENGDEIVITRNGREVARIVPAAHGRMSREDAVARLKTFAKDTGTTLGGIGWRDLRDEGRKPKPKGR